MDGATSFFVVLEIQGTKVPVFVVAPNTRCRLFDHDKVWSTGCIAESDSGFSCLGSNIHGCRSLLYDRSFICPNCMREKLIIRSFHPFFVPLTCFFDVSPTYLIIT